MSITLENIVSNYNWENVFNYAPLKNQEETYLTSDIALVVSAIDGENDEENWVGVFLMKDGKFLYITAWCDYTGWGCQEGGSSSIFDSYNDVVNFGCSSDDRDRLNLKLVSS